MSQWLLYLVVLSSLFSSMFTVYHKKDSGKSRAVRPRIPLDESNFPTRSLAEWQRMPKQSLELICNRLNLVSTGSRNILADRLFQHYRLSFPEAVVSPNQQSSPVVSPNQQSSPAVVVSPNQQSSPAVVVSPVQQSSPAVVVSPPSININSTISNLDQRPDITSLINDAVARLLPTILTAARDSEQPSSQDLFRPVTVSSASGPLLTTTTTIRPQIQNGTTESNAPLVFPGLLPYTLPLRQSTSAADILPAVPQKIQQQIKNGEFINFNQLLPSASPISTDDYAIKINQEPSSGLNASISLVPRHQRQPKICDFNSWLTAWNTFIRCTTFYHPHLTSQLLYYQTMISQFASQYHFNAWFTFDKLFRYRIAQQPSSLRWDYFDEELFNRYIRGSAAQVVCFLCNTFGHISHNCPSRRLTSGTNPPNFDNSPNNPSASIPNSMPPFRAPQRSASSSRNPQGSVSSQGRTCNYFNNRGQCINNQCQYSHKCRICFGDHPQTHCPKRLSKY